MKKKKKKEKEKKKTLTLRSSSLVSSDRLVTRTLLSSPRRCIESPIDIPAAPRLRTEGGTYPPFAPAAGSKPPPPPPAPPPPPGPPPPPPSTVLRPGDEPTRRRQLPLHTTLVQQVLQGADDRALVRALKHRLHVARLALLGGLPCSAGALEGDLLVGADGDGVGGGLVEGVAELGPVAALLDDLLLVWVLVWVL